MKKDIRVTVCPVDKPTRNGRIYSKEVWENALKDSVVTERLKTGFFGELNPDPYNDNVDLNNIAFVVKKIYRYRDIKAVIRPIDTPAGRDLSKLLSYSTDYVTFYTEGTGEAAINDDGTINIECYKLNKISARENNE